MALEAKNEKPKDKQPKLITIVIDGEEYEVEEKEHTVGELLVVSGNDPDTTYLVERKGKGQDIEHKDVDEVLKLHNKMEFVTADRGPATVA